jgi:hypothetical protein
VRQITKTSGVGWWSTFSGRRFPGERPVPARSSGSKSNSDPANARRPQHRLKPSSGRDDIAKAHMNNSGTHVGEFLRAIRAGVETLPLPKQRWEGELCARMRQADYVEETHTQYVAHHLGTQKITSQFVITRSRILPAASPRLLAIIIGCPNARRDYDSSHAKGKPVENPKRKGVNPTEASEQHGFHHSSAPPRAEHVSGTEKQGECPWSWAGGKNSTHSVPRQDDSTSADTATSAHIFDCNNGVCDRCDGTPQHRKRSGDSRVRVKRSFYTSWHLHCIGLDDPNADYPGISRISMIPHPRLTGASSSSGNPTSPPESAR